MKKFSFLLALLCAVTITHAQMDQGKALFSGGFGFSSNQGKVETKIGNDLNIDLDAKVTDFNFGAYAGIFIADNVALGLEVGYTNAGLISYPADNQTMKMNASLMMFSPSLTMFAEMGRDFYFRGTGFVGFGFGQVKSEIIDGSTSTVNSNKMSAFQLGIAPGFSYMLSDYFSLDLYWGFLGYVSQTEKVDLGTDGDYMHTKSNSLGLNLDLNSLRIGISIQI